MDILNVIWQYVVPFLVVLTALVFVHELGHYWVARRCGVRVEVFSVGFGPEIYGWTDRRGTRWKLSWIPIGGYVKMFGEMEPVAPTDGPVMPASPQDLAVSFQTKTVGQRSAIVAAGPIANFLFAILLLAGTYMVVGQPHTPAQVGAVVPGSAAERAGLQAGDVIARIDGSSIGRFEEIQRIVQLAPGRRLEVAIVRDGRAETLALVPDTVEVTDRFGNTQTIGRLGITRSGQDTALIRHDPFTAIWRATQETYVLTVSIFEALGQIIAGTRTTKELGGPIRIAQMSGDVAEMGIVSLIMFAALLSINLGLINLFPIPMLDGGHLMFYAIEAVRGRPMGERAREYGFRIGLALVLTLMLFATWNDLVHLRVFDFFVELIT